MVTQGRLFTQEKQIAAIDFLIKKVYNTAMKIFPFTQNDYDGLYAFMRPLWLETYGEILPTAQIELLLDKYFSKDGLAHYRALGYEYYKLTENGETVGVLVFVERTTDVYMDKLYLRANARGKGYPAQAFDFMLQRGKPITLNVNQKNTRAMRCYEKNGFTFLSQEEIPLGNGMVNRDFVLQKRKEQ